MKSENRGISNPSTPVIIVHLSALVFCRINQWSHEIKLWPAPEEMLQEDKRTCIGWNIQTHTTTNLPHPKTRPVLPFCFSLSSSAAQDSTVSTLSQAQDPLLPQGTPVCLVPTPSVPSSQHWAHSSLAGALTTCSLPHSGRTWPTLCMRAELELHGSTYSSACLPLSSALCWISAHGS